jgi:hypothetical protein
MKKKCETGVSKMEFAVKIDNEETVVKKGLLLVNEGGHCRVLGADVGDVDLLRYGSVIIQMVMEAGLGKVFMKLLEEEFLPQKQ